MNADSHSPNPYWSYEMLDKLTNWLFDPSGLTPHGFCLLWEPGLVWLYAISDIAIGLAYFTIPVALVVFVRRRNDLAFKPLFVLFAAFILLCGTGHWLDLLTLWLPAYGIEGLVKSATGAVSLLTAAMLWKLLPQALALPSPRQLRKANEALAEGQQQALDLNRSNADLRQFAYIVSHDLKAPLRAISSLTGWIDEDIKGIASAETLENIRLTRQRVARMDGLLDGLLAYTRVGHDNATVETLNLSELVADIIGLLAPPSGFLVRVQGEAPQIRSPRPPLEHVLHNLISNAIKHHDRSTGNIVVSARMIDGMTEIRVEDDGPGIAPEFHERIFTIFQTLKRQDESESNGVGLSIVQKIVERLGGRVWIESAPPRRGTAFVFTLKTSPA